MCCDLYLALFPDLRQVMPPGFLQTGKEKIGTTQEKNLWHRRVATSEGREVLINHGLKQRCNDLFDRYPSFEQCVRIRFGKNAALAAHFVQCVSRVAHL